MKPAEQRCCDFLVENVFICLYKSVKCVENSLFAKLHKKTLCIAVQSKNDVRSCIIIVLFTRAHTHIVRLVRAFLLLIRAATYTTAKDVNYTRNQSTHIQRHLAQNVQTSI